MLKVKLPDLVASQLGLTNDQDRLIAQDNLLSPEQRRLVLGHLRGDDRPQLRSCPRAPHHGLARLTLGKSERSIGGGVGLTGLVCRDAGTAA